MQIARIAWIGVCLLWCATVSFGQIKSSTINGTVTDATGAIVPGAEVVVTNEETNVGLTSTSNEQGEFLAPYLSAGRYAVIVKKAGFSTTRRTGLVLGTAQSVRVDVALQAGQVESMIEVTADGAQLQTESATVQNTINETIIKEVPNINHNPLYYAALQPGLTDRFNRVRSINLNKRNAFGMLGEWVFPGYNGEDRNLYKTSYDKFGPRFGLAYRVQANTVVRAGYGLMYLPGNTGFFGTGGFYGMDAFAFSTNNDNAIAYGQNPNGRPTGRFNQVNVIIPPLGARVDAPEFYGGSNFAYFTNDGYKNGNLQQFNLTLEHRFGSKWLASVAYVGSKGSHLPVSRVPLNSNQYVEPSILATCRANYIARNGSGSSCGDAVRNPFQPTSGPLLNFGGSLRNATIPYIDTVRPYPSIPGSGIVGTFGWSNYNSLQATITRSLGNGLQFNANYVWSKSLGLDASEAQANGFADGGFGYNGGNLDLRNLSENYAHTLNDIPHRFVTSFVYELPFGKGKRFDAGNAINWLTGGWQLIRARLSFSCACDFEESERLS